MGLLDSELPEGRHWLRVRDCYQVTRKPRGLRLDGERVPFVTMEAMPQGGHYQVRYEWKELNRITSGTYFERGDLLIAKITPSFENGKQAWVKDFPTRFGYATTEVIPLRPVCQEHDRRFLFFYLLHPEVRAFVAERMEGSTGRQRVPEQVLLDLPYPALPFEEQKHIADTFEHIFVQIDVENRSVRTTQELKSAAMRELFTRGLRGEPQKETEIGPVPESWEPRTILELCEIWSGGTPKKSNTEYWKGHIPWVSGKDLKRPTLNDTVDHLSVEGVEAGSRLAPAGAVLLLVRGMGLAKDLPVAVINRPMAFNQDVKALVSRGRYSGWFLRSAIYAGKERLLSQIVPSAHGTMTLNLNDVETFKVACPSDPKEADEIVSILDAIDRKIDLHRRKRAVLDELFKSLLHKLMTGEVRVADLDLSALSEPAPT